jgi:hypothetical protein
VYFQSLPLNTPQGAICTPTLERADERVLIVTGHLHKSERVSMDEAEGGDRCTNPPTHFTPFSLHSCLRVVVLLYGVRQTNRIG